MAILEYFVHMVILEYFDMVTLEYFVHMVILDVFVHMVTLEFFLHKEILEIWHPLPKPKPSSKNSTTNKLPQIYRKDVALILEDYLSMTIILNQISMNKLF